MTFEPSAARGAELDSRMRDRLADSLDYLFSQIGEDVGIDPAAAERASAEVRAAAQSPQRFGAYYDLVLAIERDEIDEARRHAEELIGFGAASGLRVAAIGDRPDQA